MESDLRNLARIAKKEKKNNTTLVCTLVFDGQIQMKRAI